MALSRRLTTWFTGSSSVITSARTMAVSFPSPVPRSRCWRSSRMASGVIPSGRPPSASVIHEARGESTHDARSMAEQQDRRGRDEGAAGLVDPRRTAPEPLAFTIEDPARISLDLPGTSLGLGERRRDIKRGVLDTVMMAEAQGRTRIVLNLDSMVPYETLVAGDQITLTLGAPAATVATARPSVFGQPSGAPDPTPVARGGVEISSVDFRRSPDGAGRVIVDLSDPSVPIDIREEADRTVVEFRGATLPDELLRRLDVLDFATPVEYIDSVRFPGGARFISVAGGEYERHAYVGDDQFSIVFGPGEAEDMHGLGV